MCRVVITRDPAHASQNQCPFRDKRAVGASSMNITEIHLKNKPPTTGGQKSESSADYRAWRDEVAERLHENGHLSEAERWDYCDNSPRTIINRNQPTLPPSAETVWVCSASHEHDAVLFSSSCDFRICPDCAPRHSARLIARYIPAIEKEMRLHPEYRLRTLTLTRSIQLGDKDFGKHASEGFLLIQKAMKKVVGENWNKDGAGLLANWEVGSKGLKLHYHAVYLGNWVDQKELSKVWKKLTGGDYRVWVKLVKHNDGDWQGAVIECLKYATKFYKEDKRTGERKYLSPELTVQLFEALKNTRRIRSYGSFHRIDEPPERVFCCEDCGSKMVNLGLNYWEVWCETGFTREGWKQVIHGSLLSLRTADNYSPATRKTDKSHPKSTRLLPGFEKIHVTGTAHYDY